MEKYIEISRENAKEILKVLKSELSINDCYRKVNALMPSGYLIVNDIHGLVGDIGGKALEASDDFEWKRIGSGEPHWYFGPADLDRIGCFYNDYGGTYLTRDQMIQLFDGHIQSFKKLKSKTKSKIEAIDEDKIEIARLKELLKKNGIPF